jgi:hypothetical protein
MMYTIYSESTGQILKVVDTTDIDSQIQSGEAWIDGAFDDSNYYIQNSLPVEIPPKPSNYYIFDFNTKQWVLDENIATNDVLQKRKKLLYSSDWTQIPNNPLTTEQQTAWEVYRQELRDVTSQPGYPFNVIWPTAPQG